MALLSKYPVFCFTVAFCALVFAVGSYLAFAESANLLNIKREIAKSEAQLRALLDADPALTESNLRSAEENVIQLSRAIQTIRDELDRGSRLELSTDSIRVMAGIQQYISEFQRMVRDHLNTQGAIAPIATPDDFAFGFERYIDDTAMFDDSDKAALIDKQRQILTYLVARLIESNPQEIREIRREVLEMSDEDSFVIDPLVSARVPGAIDTMAFSLKFDAYTDSLRIFLNKLAAFDLPIVVRSISVSRPAGKQTVLKPKSSGDLDAIFGTFGEDTSEGERAEVQRPVIEENASTFTVILEFIELVLSRDATEELS